MCAADVRAVRRVVLQTLFEGAARNGLPLIVSVFMSLVQVKGPSNLKDFAAWTGMERIVQQFVTRSAECSMALRAGDGKGSRCSALAGAGKQVRTGEAA